MKRLLLILFSLLICLFSFGQKNEIYLNDNLIKITKPEFDKKTDPHKYYNLRYDLDSLIANIKVQRIKKGILSKSRLDSIRNDLSVISNRKINNQSTLVINYYHGLDRCNSGPSTTRLRAKYKYFTRKIKKLDNVTSFFIYREIGEAKKYGKHINWLHDKTKIIENTFFPISYPCGSYVIIDHNGNYYIRKGEYNIVKVIDTIKNKKEIFSTASN
ncbi:hypothetical protein [uncultured Lacinutrix sp.]|uniref:hypothetical protein n=1 Tax=uncultured Lacinutrix sp. TaxID=574032 RepID=UPI0026211D9F|nr:hypothetical protein [uncultured Lacinutrix sp.]